MITIILISAIAVLLVLTLYFWRSANNRISKAITKAEGRSHQEIKNLETEIHRLSYINKDLQEKVDSAASESSAPRLDTDHGISLASAEQILIEQKRLEAEKEDMANRNRKLWDMSIQIQKEKQRVQILKNQIELKHKNITDSIIYAKRIQDAVLPREDVLGNVLSDYFLFWLPKETVSGDFYWMKRQGDFLVFAVADCTGHGVPGAFMSMMGVTFLNEICSNISAESTPSDILEQLRSLVISTLKQDNMNPLEPKDGMDISLCVLDCRTKILKWSGANNPLYLVRDGVLTEYKPVKNPIGLYPRLRPFATTEIQTQPGDYLYMFSDGFADQFNGQTGKKVTYGRFKTLLEDINKTTSKSDEQVAMLNDFMNQWRAGFIQMDDILVGGYRI
ncbi:MAG: SpoIIE family protein phosphatase [Bacteroidales bacterium]|nr:SpoIIE family protein phosphatase [Bacteroidales bacterium]